MDNHYNLKAMVEKIKTLKKTANELKEMSGGNVAVNVNITRMSASIRVLEIDICDVADILLENA